MNTESMIAKVKQTVRLLAIFACLMITTLASAAISPTKPSGSGTSSNPYLIGNANELYWFAQLVNGTGSESQNASACAKLTANITVNSAVLDPSGNLLSTTYKYTVWEPIGYHNSDSDYARFTGTIDGNGKTISGLYLNNTSRSYIGFCGYGGGTVKNLGIVDSYFKGGQHVGVVYGYNEGTVSQCYSKGTAIGSVAIGGVCGSTAYGKVENCYNQGKVSATENHAGGVVGANLFGKISNCYNAGTVNCSTTNRGGVCGYNPGGTISNCYYDNSKCSSGGIANADVASQAEGKSSSIFLSGEVAYKLQGSQSSAIWGQTISSDIYPTLGGKKVNYGYINCTDIAYSNNETSDTPKHSYDNGFCTVCGALQPAELVSSTNHPELMGTHNGFYTIGNAGQLYWYANKVNNDRQASIDAVLVDHIFVNYGNLNENFEFSGGTSDLRVWNPIGWKTDTGYVKYNGVFDGNNYNINGLYIDNTNANYVGFIGYYGGTVRNLAVINSILKGGSNVGGICGWCDGTITNCYYYGSVQGTSNVGGLCGQSFNTYSIINNSFFAGKISGTTNVGSIIGKSNGIVANCYYDSTKSAVGGICGADISGKAEGKTFEQFQSGEVAYLLSLGCTIDGEKYNGDSWGQILGFLDYPFLGSRKVYFGYEEGTCNVVYSNSPLNTTPTHSFDEKGICTACGGYKPAEIISASHHPEMCEKHDGYYAIECAGNLYWFAEQVNAGNTAANAVLAADIVDNEGVLDSGGSPVAIRNFRKWTPIGYYYSATDKLLYSGNFDGNGKTISGLRFEDLSRNYVGMFGANGGKIENVGIVESYIRGNNNVGSICGYNLGGVITNCYNHSCIAGSDYIGGICGSTTSSISNCYNIGTLRAETDNKSAICGDYTSGNITNCYCIIEYSKDENNAGVTKFKGEFKNGKVAYLLQGNQSTQVWGQTIGTDEYPVIYGERVYYGYDCAGLKYANEELPTTQPDHAYDKHGFCEVCHAHQEAKPVSETHHPELLETHSGYYAIENGGQLCWFAESKNSSANAVLTDDVYINEFDFSKPIDPSKYLNNWTQISSFSGKFDGNGHIINGLYIPYDYSNNGMFMTITGEVSNFALKNFIILGWDNSSPICSINHGTIRNCSTDGKLNALSENTDYCSGICSINYGTIVDCSSATTIEAESKPDFTGGICGVNYGTVDNCTNQTSVIGGLYVGGIVGDNEGTITNCVSRYFVNGDNSVGGICGHNKGVVSNCENTNTIDSSTNAGGICGYNEGDILYCGNQKSVISPTGCGGICGANSGNISHCTNYNGTLSSLKNAGGICAENGTSGTIEYCSAAGNIESLDIKTPIVNSAGVCSLNRGTILNCCSSVKIEGNDCVGGIVGENKGIVANCYYKGIITNGDTNVGSICGINNATIAYCYYDRDKESTEAFPNSDLAENVVGKSSAEFRSGEVAYALQQGGTITANGNTITFDGDYWGQILGAEDYPVIDSDYKVLRAEKEADSSYWTTFSDLSSDSELSVPSGNTLKVCNATVSAGKLALTSRYNNQVAAGEGVLAKTDCQYLNATHLDDTNLVAEEAELNNLVATPATAQTITAESGYLFYDLAFDNNGESLAFYLGQAKDANGNVTSSDGKKLTVSPGKAYLKVASSNAVDPATQAPAQILIFPDNIGTSGVDEIIGDDNNGRYEKDVVYDLWGRKVKNPTRGIYIRNGQKIVIR